MLSSVAHTSHQLLIRLLKDPAFVSSGSGEEMAAQLAAISGVRNQSEEIARLLDAVAALDPGINSPGKNGPGKNYSGKNGALQTEIVLGVAKGLKQVDGRLPFDPASARAGERMLVRLAEAAKQTAADIHRSEQERAEAIRLLGCFGRDVADATLREQLSPANPEGVQAAAVDALSRIRKSRNRPGAFGAVEGIHAERPHRGRAGPAVARAVDDRLFASAAGGAIEHGITVAVTADPAAHA